MKGWLKVMNITVYHETQTFAKKFCKIPHTFPNLNSAILNLHIKELHGHAKTMETAKLFCLKTFMVYGIYCHLQTDIFRKCILLIRVIVTTINTGV